MLGGTVAPSNVRPESLNYLSFSCFNPMQGCDGRRRLEHFVDRSVNTWYKCRCVDYVACTVSCCCGSELSAFIVHSVWLTVNVVRIIGFVYRRRTGLEETVLDRGRTDRISLTHGLDPRAAPKIEWKTDGWTDGQRRLHYLSRYSAVGKNAGLRFVSSRQTHAALC